MTELFRTIIHDKAIGDSIDQMKAMRDYTKEQMKCILERYNSKAKKFLELL